MADRFIFRNGPLRADTQSNTRLTPAPINFYVLTHTATAGAASKVVFSSPLWAHLPLSKGYQNILVTNVISFFSND